MMKQIQKEIIKHLPQSGEARRLFHGRGDCFPGFEDLVIDCYLPVVMIILYKERDDEWLSNLSELLLAEVPGATCILLQERFRTGSPSRLLAGELPDEVDAVEAGLRFRLRLGDAQNVGFFPDMSQGRKLVRERAEGKRVLNLFSYSCSFSLAALAGGAKQVVNVDMNRGALELGRFNHQQNGIDLRSVGFMKLDIFKSWSKLRKIGSFDLIICDPPETQGKSFNAKCDWSKLVRHLPPLLADGGELVACLCSPRLKPKFVYDLVIEHLPTAELQTTLYGGVDFPEKVVDAGVSIQHFRMKKDRE